MSDKPNKLMPDKNVSKVPSSRLARMGKLGSLAGSIAAHALSNTAGQLLKAKRPSLQSTLLTTSNASSLAKSLSEMRGAAMKVGQMLSMDAGEFLPAEWEPILATLRQGADAMPKTQLLETLQKNWGANWANHFKYFSFEPVASASIGQVHKAQLKNGDWLAVKVQYPGVAASIDSDVSNIGRLIKMTGMLPKGFDIQGILDQAKLQLQSEANYLQEAQYLRQFKQHLQGFEHFVVPDVYNELSNQEILCMSFIDGAPIESVIQQSEHEKSTIMSQLFALLLSELFVFSLVQSDPNFANYLYLPDTKQIALLDFGACRQIPVAIQTHYQLVATSMLNQNREGIETGMRGLKLIHHSMPEDVREAILNGCLIASECLQTKNYNIKQSALIQRLYDATKILMQHRKAIEPPDFDVALVNRKVSGMVLLANKMQCSIDLQGLVKNTLDLE
ncbi:ABC1 kinase family protein [Glaciecola sp. SC05]|uniref:ABC1 kinase family protein n=1 Tax=Glaciecola sp. SC05 TaxID=1987355 RepID=UPI0035270B3A